MQSVIRKGLFVVKKDTETHILLSTIESIEKYGIQNITTRVIADEAGVNNAAIHYYFRTKEQLIDAALNQTLNHMLEDTTDMLSTNEEISTRLRNVFDYLIDGVLRYPNLIRAHLNSAIMEGNPDAPFLKLWTFWMDAATENLGITNQDAQRQIKTTMHSIISTILFSGLIPANEDIPSRVQLADAEFRTELIESAVKSIVDNSSAT